MPNSCHVCEITHVISRYLYVWFRIFFKIFRVLAIWISNLWFELPRPSYPLECVSLEQPYIKLLKKSHNFHFPAKCNNWGRPIKIHEKMMKLIQNAKKNRYIRIHFSFFVTNPYLLSYLLESFRGKFEIGNFYK